MKIVSTEKTIQDVTTWSDERRASLRFTRTEETDEGTKIFAVYPKGTEVFGAQAEQLLALGKAEVVDDD